MQTLPHIPGYKLIKKIGQGGMADVYLGLQENLDRKVAIKVLMPALFRDESFSIRFIKEAQTAAKLVHPNIITIHDVGMAENSYYIVMEYLEESLYSYKKKTGSLHPSEALRIVRQIAQALDYAHSKGFIHRDIKPDNIMFRMDGTPVLVDFGIARAIDSNTQLTRTGMSLGTPHYMSPEQCRGEAIDGRSDLYSLGVQLFELLTGHVPYKAENTTGIILKHIQDPIPTLPDHLSKYQILIDKTMAKDKYFRVQNGAELVSLIDTIKITQEFASSMERPTTGAYTLPLTMPSTPKPQSAPVPLLTDALSASKRPSGSMPSSGAASSGNAVPSGSVPYAGPAPEYTPMSPRHPSAEQSIHRAPTQIHHSQKPKLIISALISIIVIMTGVLIYYIIEQYGGNPPVVQENVNPIDHGISGTSPSTGYTSSPDRTSMDFPKPPPDRTGVNTHPGGSNPPDDRSLPPEDRPGDHPYQEPGQHHPGDDTQPPPPDKPNKQDNPDNRKPEPRDHRPDPKKEPPRNTNNTEIVTMEPSTSKPNPTPQPPANSVTILDIHPEIRKEYALRMERFTIHFPNPRGTVKGQITLELSVNEYGTVDVQPFSWIETLNVVPQRMTRPVIGAMIRNLGATKLPPPKDKSGNPVRLIHWRLTFKVGKLGEKIIMNRQ